MLVLVMAASAFLGPASHLAGRTGHASLRRPSSPQMVEGSPSQSEVGWAGSSIPTVGGAASILAGMITWAAGGRTLPQLGAAVVTVGTFAATAAGLRKEQQRRPGTIEDNAARVLLESKVTIEDYVGKAQVFVPRPEFAESVRISTRKPKSAYLVVEGPRGCGKTLGVVHALTNDTGVVCVEMSNTKDACATISEALGVPRDFTLTENQLRNVLNKTRTMRMGRNPASAQWRPTIIAELTRNPGTCTYNGTQVTLMKELSADRGLANVILVLSDADAAFAMPKDDDRQYPIWVDDFTEDEAHAYLDKLEYLLPPPPPSSPSPPPPPPSPPPPPPSPPPPSPSDCSGDTDLRKELLYETGTRVSTLTKAAGFHGTLHEFIATKQVAAERDIEGLVYNSGGERQNGPAFMRLVIDLLENTCDGRSLQGFDARLENLGLPCDVTTEYLEEPATVCELFKSCHAWHYHRPSDSYRFHSTSHRRAAERLFPQAAAVGAAKSRAGVGGSGDEGDEGGGA